MHTTMPYHDPTAWCTCCNPAIRLEEEGQASVGGYSEISLVKDWLANTTV